MTLQEGEDSLSLLEIPREDLLNSFRYLWRVVCMSLDHLSIFDVAREDHLVCFKSQGMIV